MTDTDLITALKEGPGSRELDMAFGAVFGWRYHECRLVSECYWGLEDADGKSVTGGWKPGSWSPTQIIDDVLALHDGMIDISIWEQPNKTWSVSSILEDDEATHATIHGFMTAIEARKAMARVVSISVLKAKEVA